MNWGDPRLPDHFWAQCVPVPFSGCWLFLTRQVNGGYTQVSIGGVRQLTHRVTYEKHHGYLPAFEHGSLELDHICRTPCCCNPHHLELVTHAVNSLRGASQTAVNAVKSECMRGHPFTPRNTITCRRKDGTTYRNCRACKALYRAKARPDVGSQV